MNEDLLGYSKERVAIDRLKEAYTFSQKLGLGPLYVAFSGGKDSTCIYHLCKMSGKEMGVPDDQFAEYHYNITNLDPPELVQFIKTFPDVRMDHPPTTFWKLVSEKYRVLPTRLLRYCCKDLKERGGTGRFCVTGVRWAESTRRKTRGALEAFGASRKEARILNADNDEDRRELEHCIPKRKYICNPIVDWSDDEVWEFINGHGFRYCSLYDEGFKRLGCIGCPNASPREREREFLRWPKYKEQYMRTIERMLDNRKKKGLPLLNGMDSPEEVFMWWLEMDNKTDITLWEEKDG